MSLPFLWTSVAEWRVNAAPVIIGLWGLVATFCLLSQINFTRHHKKVLIRLIAIAALIEGAFCFLQIIYPLWSRKWLSYDIIAAQGRPLGAFMQVNLLGSFLAVGLACFLWLQINERRSLIRKLYLVASGILTISLVLTHSRTGWLGATLTYIAVFSVYYKTPVMAILLKANLPVLAISLIVGIYIIPSFIPHPILNPAKHEPVSVIKPYKTVTPLPETFALSRMRQESFDWRRQMLLGGALMIYDHPVAGNGLGSFEALFPEVLSSWGYRKQAPVTITHPHNELIYIWAEGGLCGLTGFVLLASLWAKFIWRRCNRNTLSMLCLSLPLWVHMMTEFPLYLSSAHALTLVLLLRIAIPSEGKVGRLRITPFSMTMFKMSVVISGAIALFFLSAAWQTQRKIFFVEHNHFMSDIAALSFSEQWAQHDRLIFDKGVIELMQFNQTKDPYHLAVFIGYAVPYLTAHNDAEMAFSLIRILKHYGYQSQADYWRKRSAVAFPSDPRFQTWGQL
ncbi:MULTISPECIES: O-antigen ligase family protein [Enterobacter]|uniref:O-antigen ligase family protein n=1 Tax=Enterobacter TaxID=547 RepID=UPI0013F4C930|nr:MULTISPECIES: O-antigen ligase family protein [Enterobacter]MBS0865796.1 O-antigen ligase family protein [Enterobacter mori]